MVRSWRRWRWLSETHLCPRSLPRLLGLGAREGRRLHRARHPLLQNPPSSASSGDILRISFSAGSTLRAALFPGRVGTLRHVSLLLMSSVYLVGGAPRAASSPSRSSLTQWHVSILLLPNLVCLLCLIYLRLSPARLLPTTGLSLSCKSLAR